MRSDLPHLASAVMLGIAMKIAEGLYSISERKGRVHAFLVDAGAELILVDTLYDVGAGPLLAYLRDFGRPVTDIRHIVLTHAHRSHLGGVALLKRITGATVYAHESEADIIAGERKAQAVTLRPIRPVWRYRNVYIPFQVGLALGFGAHPPCPVDAALDEGDTIGPLHVLHAPGHTPGHLALYWPESGALLSGDAIATWPELAPGWRAFNLNPRRHAHTLERLAGLDAQVVGVGHGEPITHEAQAHVRELAETAAKWA
jgi:glyoxylase-like metal-dependent hydrolase (beta-lactamase superfamily II)